MTQIPPLKRLLIPLLYFNKCDPSFERSLHRNIDHLRRTGLVDEVVLKESRGFAVDMARNVMVQFALEEGFDALAWLDTDMIYPDDGLAKLVQMSQAGYPIAAGLYRRGIGARQLLAELEWEKPCEVDELRAAAEGGVTRVAMAAGGFSIVRSHLYIALAKKHKGKVPWYCNYDWIAGHGMCGEDRFFVLRANEIGIRPVVDPELHAVHWPPGTSPVPVLDNDPLLALVKEYL